jgi:hypothetical protein
MLKLVASAPGDGWAFVQRGEETLLVRPPYQQWALTSVSEGAVETAVQHHGFVLEEKSFSDWGSLIAHLKEQYLAWRHERGVAIPDVEEVRSLIHLAPTYILENYMNRIEDELLPQGEWQAAMKLLAYLLGVEAVKSDSDLYERALGLLQMVEVPIPVAPVQEVGFLQKFPHAVKVYGAAAIRSYAEAISRQHQIFAPV